MFQYNELQNCLSLNSNPSEKVGPNSNLPSGNVNHSYGTSPWFGPSSFLKTVGSLVMWQEGSGPGARGIQTPSMGSLLKLRTEVPKHRI